jgi:hypothetical protein
MANVEQLIGVKTDLDLNKSGALPMAAVDVGLGPDSLSPATRAALTKGYQTDCDCSSGYEEITQDPTGQVSGGFLGRPTGFQR